MGKLNEAVIGYPKAFHDDPMVPIQFDAAFKRHAYRLPEPALDGRYPGRRRQMLVGGPAPRLEPMGRTASKR